MRPIVARVETITEFSGISFADDLARPISLIVRCVVLISATSSVGGKSTNVAHGTPPSQYSSTLDFGVPPLSMQKSSESPRETRGNECSLRSFSRYLSPLRPYSPPAAIFSFSAISPSVVVYSTPGSAIARHRLPARSRPRYSPSSSLTCGKSFSAISRRCAPKPNPSFSTLKKATRSVFCASALSSSRMDVLTPE